MRKDLCDPRKRMYHSLPVGGTVENVFRLVLSEQEALVRASVGVIVLDIDACWPEIL